MQVIDKQQASFISTCDRKNNQFRQNLLELKNQINTLNETFLEKLSRTLELKHCITKEQVTSISIIFSLAAIATKHEEQIKQQPINTTSIQKIQDLSRFICPEKGPKKFQIIENMTVGWMTQIWDKLMHFSFYNNFIDLSFLFYFIGDSLLYFQHQLQRLSKILLSSVSKIKTLSIETLNITLVILDQFIENIEGKKVTSELKIRFKILKILFLSKIDQPNEQQIKLMKTHLHEFYDNYLDLFIQTLKRIEQTGMIKEEDIVWDRFLTIILTYYHRIQQIHKIAKQIIIEMVSFRIDMQTMKLMIKQLEITNEQIAPLKWKRIFDLLQITLIMFDKPKEAILFLNSKSYLKMPLEHSKIFFIQISIKNQTKTYLEEKFLFAIQSNDRQNKNKSESLWVTAINQIENQLKLIILIVQNKNIVEKHQKLLKWKQYASNTFLLQFNLKHIKFQINNHAENSITIDRFIKNPQTIVIGDQNNMLGTSIKQFLSLQSYLQPRTAITDSCFRLNLGNKQYFYVGLRKKILPSFPDIVKAVGDLDIFLLLISHIFKKMKKNPKSIEMIRYSLALMESLVEVKGVRNIRLNLKQKQQRTNAILCLCWQCSHQSQNAVAVLELLRVLSLRGVSNFQDELEVLSNFVFWRQFEWEYQKLIIMKIKEIFMQMRTLQNYHKYVHKYCKRILMEAALYYREEDTLNIYQQKSQILKIHYQFMNLAKEQIEHHIYNKKSPELVYEFIEFLLKMLYLTLSRRNNANNFQTFDITFSIQLSILLRNIANCLSEWRGKDEILFQILKNALQICKVYEVEENYFQEKTLRIYEGEKGFVAIDEGIIKQNLFFVAYKLISFKQGILNVMVQQEEYGAPEITSITWQRQFFDLIILKKSENQFMFEDKPQIIQNLLMKKKRLAIKYLSKQQNKIFLRIYLRHKDIFPQIQYILSTHFWKVIEVKEVVQIIKSQILFNAKQFTEHTSNSKMVQSQQMKELGLFRDKILNILAINDDLISHQGLLILKTFQLIYPTSLTQTYRNVFFHFILKNIIEKTKQLVIMNESSISVSSHHTDKQAKTSASQISTEQVETSVVLTRQQYIKCVQFYLNHLKVNDIMIIKGITDIQEGNAHFQNYRINIISIMNQLASVQPHIMSKLKNYYFFLKEFLLQLSKYYLQIREIVPIFKEGAPRKGSRHHLQLPNSNLKEQSKMMYLKFTQQRKHFLLKVEQIWQKVEERNKYFWSNFLGREMQYTLHDATGPMNERYLLKKSTKKAKLQLPRMIRNSIIKSTSIVSEKYDFNETQSQSVSSSILDDAKLYRKEPNNCLSSNKESQPQRQRKSNNFIVLLITNSKIFQGILTVTPKKMTFRQTEEINQVLYKRIYASQGERRSPEQCIRQNYKFQEQLSYKCKAIAKRYLFHDLALEFHTRSRSYLFSFINKGHRQAVTMILQKTMRIVYRNSINDEAKRLFQKWQSGKISNYTYLMKLNDVAGRSFNDLSQYYVFPWTVTNFKDEMDLSFFKNKQNFREMSIPVGKISKTKWQNIRNNFEKSKNDEIGGIKPFLYGSFYSNPAIVSNFLIRINPFASQHYQLQSNQFDLADRLFYSIQDSYRSLTMCSSDFKELIPQFYYFPQFLKNRNKYNLGSRQNKDIVNNVLMPRWAQNEYQFVFRMKKILQSSHVTNGLHLWIDLIFGVYTKRQYALKADNLFLQNLYIDSYNACINDKNKEVNMYYKQFGQVPVSVFTSNHKPTAFSGNYLDLINHETTKYEQYIVNKNNENGKLLKIDFSKRFIFFLFDRQIKIYLDERFVEKECISMNGQFEGGSLFSWQIVDEKYKKRSFLLVHRKKTFQLLGFQVKKNLFNRYSLEGGEVLAFKHRVELFTVYDNQLICSQGKNIYVYKKIEEEVEEQYSTQNSSIVTMIAKNKFLFKTVAQITQHKSRVLFLSVSQKGMLVSIDEQNRVFIMEIGTMAIDIFNYFEIKGIYCQQKIQEIFLHNLGFIIMRTDYDRILMYSFLGDKVVDKILCFKRINTNVNQEKAQTMALWNPQFCEIIIGTNIGNLWKLDLFAIRHIEQIEETMVWIQKIHLNKDGFRKEGLIKSAVNRIGRHSLMLIYGENTKFYVIKSQKWDEIKKKQLEGKKKENPFW